MVWRLIALAPAALTVSLSAAAGPTSDTSPSSVPGAPALSGPELDEPLCQDRPTDELGVANDPDAAITESARLGPMLGVVLAYGTERPDSFTSYGLDWTAPDDASVFVSFARDVAVHRAALLEVVPFPDELIVCRARMSGNELVALEQHLLSELDGRFTQLSRERSGQIGITLYASEEAIAAQLVETYGDRILVHVGLFPYPLPNPLPDSVCEQLPAQRAPSGLELTVHRLDEPVTVSGPGWQTIEVTLTNVGDETIQFGYGVLQATPTRPGDDIGPANLDGVFPSVLNTVTLEPGDRHDATVTVPNASCDPNIGYLLAPGNYDLYVVVEPVEPIQNVPNDPFTLGPVTVTVST